MTITQLERVYRIVETIEPGKAPTKTETFSDAEIMVASWGRESKVNFKKIWFDPYMDDLADLLKGSNLSVSTSLVTSAPINLVGRWIDENINGVYLTYFY